MQFKCHHHRHHHHDGAPQHECWPFVCALDTMCLDLKVCSQVHNFLETLPIGVFDCILACSQCLGWFSVSYMHLWQTRVYNPYPVPICNNVILL